MRVKKINRSSFYGPEKQIVPEEFLWAIWECLARGLCVLAHGNENLDGPVWERPGILHLDIKPQNSEFLGFDAVGLTDFDSITWRKR
jgi:serine/threonine protein kinase